MFPLLIIIRAAPFYVGWSPAPVHGLQTLQDAENDDSDDFKIYNT